MGDENLKFWKQLESPPDSAMKRITGGRLAGKSDINPQWRYKAMTEAFGPCGEGWKFTIEKLWTEQGVEGQVFCFAFVNVYIKIGDKWSEPIPGIGGSMLIDKESKGLYCNDEGFKMAVTDAMSTALKMIGVAAEVYLGNYDGSKYKGQLEKNGGNGKQNPKDTEEKKSPSGSKEQKFYAKVAKVMEEKGYSLKEDKDLVLVDMEELFGKSSSKDLTDEEKNQLIEKIKTWDKRE